MRKRPIVLMDHYRIVAAIASDDVASTYSARDTRDNQPVVIKVYSSIDRRSFNREANAFAALRHPNVVALHRVGDTPLGACLVAEDAGTSLDRRLREGALPPAQLARVGHDLLEALHAVHTAGLLHRDVKPANVFLCPLGGAKLGDFGAAHLPSPHSTMDLVPGLGLKAGTLRYMSPERVRGQLDSEAGDLYGAAATLYEAWTGRALIDYRPGESVAQLMSRVASPPPVTVAGEAGDWFRKALDPAPENRFATAREMADASPALGR